MGLISWFFEFVRVIFEDLSRSTKCCEDQTLKYYHTEYNNFGFTEYYRCEKCNKIIQK